MAFEGETGSEQHYFPGFLRDFAVVENLMGGNNYYLGSTGLAILCHLKQCCLTTCRQSDGRIVGRPGRTFHR